MSIHLKVFLLICLIIVLVFMVRQVSAKKLVLQYSLSWMFLIFGLAVVIVFPGILEIISRMIGIAVPVNTVFFLGFLFALVIIFNLTSAVSKMSVEITRLTQELALMEKKLKDEQSGESNRE